jgi:hypothetical protein
MDFMRRMLFILFPAMLCMPVAFGQKIGESDIKIGKVEAKGFVATTKYNKTQVSEVLESKLRKAGLSKHGKMKKFYTFRGVDCVALSPAKIDVYYKVQKKKHHAKIYFIASKGYDNYITSASDAAIAANINTFLGNIDDMVALNEEIKQKQLEVKLAGEKLEQDKASMQKAADEKAQKQKQLQTMKSAGRNAEK